MGRFAASTVTPFPRLFHEAPAAAFAWGRVTSRWLAALRRLDFTRVFVYLALCGVLLWAALAFIQRLGYELTGSYTWDSTLYYAVGRGILNGHAPWSELFETKPPGIFLLSALSFGLTGTAALMNLLQVLTLLCVAASVPLLLAGRDHRLQRDEWRVLVLVLMLFGVLLGMYVGERAGEVQVESFGAGFAALAVLVMASPLSVRYPRTALTIAVVGWLGACGLKEPFLFTLLGAAALLLNTRDAWWRHCVMPLAIAAGIGFAVLLVNDWLRPYVQDYLGYMAGYTGRNGSPWKRALELWRISEDMNAFSRALGYAVCLAAAAALMRALRTQESGLHATADGLRLLLAFLCAALAIGLGGEYYNHHHVFAFPILLALLACALPLLLDGGGIGGRAVRVGLTLLLAYATLALPDLELKRRHAELADQRTVAEAEARYVDAVLHAAKVDRYMFVGGNGPQLYAHTEHSPLGPFFFQLDDLADRSERLRSSYLRNLRQAQVVVFDHALGRFEAQTRQTLESDFSTEPWPEVRDIARERRHYTIWFRQRPSHGGLPAESLALRGRP